MSLPVSHCVFCQFVSDLVKLISLLCILYIYIYIPGVSLVLYELLNVMVVCLPVILFFVPSGFGLLFF